MRRYSLLLAAIVLAGGTGPGPRTPLQPAQAQGPLTRLDDFGNLPLIFEVNRGQTDSSVRFLARGDGYSLFLTPAEAVLRLRAPARGEQRQDAVVRMRLAGA